MTLKLCENDIFLYDGYQDDVLLYFKKLFNNDYISVTDFLSPRKIETDKGIWLIDKANLIVCSPFFCSFIKEIVGLPGKRLNIQGNTLIIENVKINRQEILHKGILLSGVFAHDNGNYLEYEKSPELFSERLRLNLIEIYKIINNHEEPDDKRFFISLNKGYKKQYIHGKPIYKGIYEIFGSPGLCSIFTQCFVTGKLKNEKAESK